MRVLAIETSTILGGIAVVDNEGLVSEVRFNVSVEHSERLMPEIDHLLRSSCLTINDIDAFAVSQGPGSFTGLRVGMATLKGLCFATRKPAIGVPTLEAMAWNFPYAIYPVCPVLDARRAQVFMALYRWNAHDFITLKGPSVVDRERFIELIDSLIGDEPVILTGNGYIFFKDRERFIIPPPHMLVPSASNVGYLALRLAMENRFSDPVTITPLYLRRSQAEERLQTA
jgi:tRNA threonylcarbamoyladenosine biosynthesis protein TsaB